jgi:purine-binding chemotaxis protein CheW
MAKRRQELQQDTSLSGVGSLTPDEGAATEPFLIFQIDSELFGFRLATIAEIIRPPDLAHVPLVPPSLLGLANLRGTVLPVLSLGRLLRLHSAPIDTAARVVVTRGNAPVGFVVDRIERLMAIATNQLERDDAGAGSLDPASLDGIVKGAEGERTIKILNPQRLLNGQFEQLGISGERTALRKSISGGMPGTGGASETQALVSLISFKLGTQEFALPLECVREIIPLPDHISEVPRSETAVLGVVTLRERLLPLVSLRILLGLPADSQHGQRSKVVVVSIGDGAVGMVADATREILRISPGIIDAAPALLNRGEGDAEITSICRLDNGQRLVALLSPDRLFRSDVVLRILAEQGVAASGSTTPTEASTMEDEQFIIFCLGDQEYGVPISAVGEIARPPERVTRLPKAPVFVDGVMNLRGGVLPIVDLRRRFDLAPKEEGGAQRILVLAIGGTRAGFLVDSVSEVMKVTVDAICPAPELSPDQMRLISRVVNLESSGRIILLVDCAQLLDQVEIDVLTKIGRSERSHSMNKT